MTLEELIEKAGLTDEQIRKINVEYFTQEKKWPKEIAEKLASESTFGFTRYLLDKMLQSAVLPVINSEVEKARSKEWDKIRDALIEEGYFSANEWNIFCVALQDK